MINDYWFNLVGLRQSEMRTSCLLDVFFALSRHWGSRMVSVFLWSNRLLVGTKVLYIVNSFSQYNENSCVLSIDRFLHV